MRKKILGATFMVAVMAILIVNIHISMDSSSVERLIMLNNVEMLAYGERGDYYTGHELRAGLCEDLTPYYKCVYTSSGGCEPFDEDLCEPASVPHPNVNTVAPNSTCQSLGHNWQQTNCYKTCLRCYLQVSLCND